MLDWPWDINDVCERMKKNRSTMSPPITIQTTAGQPVLLVLDSVFFSDLGSYVCLQRDYCAVKNLSPTPFCQCFKYLGGSFVERQPHTSC
jgi:hypothetical protein